MMTGPFLADFESLNARFFDISEQFLKKLEGNELCSGQSKALRIEGDGERGGTCETAGGLELSKI